MKEPIVNLTDKALAQIERLLEQRKKKSLGIRIGIKSGGCSGFKYFLEYADIINKYDELIHVGNSLVIIDPKALMYLIGSTMDYVEEQFQSGFVFINPNEKSQCGCGKSFSA